MKRQFGCFIVGLLLSGCLVARVDLRQALSKQLNNPSNARIDLNAIVPAGQWDRFCVFGPYSGYSEMVGLIGAEVFELRGSAIDRLEGVNLVVFLNRNIVVVSELVEEAEVGFYPGRACVTNATSSLEVRHDDDSPFGRWIWIQPSSR